MNDIKYAGFVPLIGGMMFGAKKALGKNPEYVLSFKNFDGNDSLYREYDKGVRFETIDDGIDMSDFPRVDIVLTLCPCAGLSQLNSSKQMGSNAPQNEWMYKTARFTLSTIKPTVMMGENAPGLFSTIGKGVLDNLRRIGLENDYSMTILKTNTIKHGIPQSRPRSFYFFWKSKTAPVLNFYDVKMPTLESYLNEVKDLIDDEELSKKRAELVSNPLYIWMKDVFHDWRLFMMEKRGSMMDAMIRSGRSDEYLEWVDINYPEYKKEAEHAIYKRANGMGFWDNSPFIPIEYTGAFTGARMNCIHPVEDRIFCRRELMHMMGLPNDMNIPDEKNMGKIFQNVPSNTSADWTREAVKFVEGKLEMTNSRFVVQNNISKTVKIENKTVSLF